MDRIYINQVGYYPDIKKIAALNFATERFELIDEGGRVCYSGNVIHRGFDADSGDDVYNADFSDFEGTGRYRVRVGQRVSDSFEIAEKVYDKTFFDINKAYYFLRCGCGLEAKYAGVYTHGKCHIAPSKLWWDHSTELDLSGGWHDAGDYGRYITAGACAVAHLLYAYRMYPHAFDKLNLNIPESGQGNMPDILWEIKYELDWFLKLQAADGGVYHKATTQRHAPFVMPEEDVAQMYALPVSSMATADFAAACAMASEVYRPFMADYADKLIAAARKSGMWLEQNPDYLFENMPDCTTGGYGEGSDTDNRFWAWSELYCATGEEHYHALMKKSIADNDFRFTGLGYGYVTGFGALTYILCDRDTLDAELKIKFENAYVAEAERLKALSEESGYMVAMRGIDYHWGSNMVLMQQGMIFAIADYIEKTDRFREASFGQLHYLLGVNAVGYSYVTGNGEHAYNNPHLRPSAADGIEACMPGMVSGGPNGRPADGPGRQFIPEGTPPMKCYLDHVGCFSLNEITIYWNSPAVFTLSSLL